MCHIEAQNFKKKKTKMKNNEISNSAKEESKIVKHLLIMLLALLIGYTIGYFIGTENSILYAVTTVWVIIEISVWVAIIVSDSSK